MDTLFYLGYSWLASFSAYAHNGKERVYPCTLLCLLTNWQERVYGYPHTIALPSLTNTGKKECTLLCLLTNWQERVYPHTIALPSLTIIILERKSVATPALFSACLLTGKKECTSTLLLSLLLLILERKSVPLHSSLPAY